MAVQVDRVSTVFGSIINKYPSFRDDDAVRSPMRYKVNFVNEAK